MPERVPGAAGRTRLRRPDWVSTLAVLALGLALISSLSWGLGWWVQRRAALAAFPVASGDLQIPGLSDSVEVIRDSRGIPHIEASTELDVWLALGFVHAQDRLGQMLWLRRVALGHTAEVMGEAGLASDKLVRTLGIGHHAGVREAALEPETRRLLTAYAVGVNARIARVTDRTVGRPVGYPAPGSEIEPWTVRDSIALTKLLAWSSGGGLERPVVLSDLLERLGSVGARPFFPTGDRIRGISVPFSMPESRDAGARTSREGIGFASGAGELAARTGFRGASAWVLSGKYSRSGAPLIVADLHLAPTLPSLVYESHLRAGGLDVAGATVPGIPVVWVGRNPHVAWAATPAQIATFDLFQEELRVVPSVAAAEADTPTPITEPEILYRTGRGWIPVEVRREIIRVKGARGVREVEHFVRETAHGPLVHDLVSQPPDGNEREPLAIAWTGAEPGDGIGSFLAIASAGDADAVVRALERHHEPVLAVAYADRAGGAGMQVAGWLPERRLPTGSVPVYGRQTAFDWRKPVSFEDLPARRLGDGEGQTPGKWLVVADNPLGLGGASQSLEYLWRTGLRSQRLEERISELLSEGGVDLREAADIQADAHRAGAPAFIAALKALAEGEPPLRPEAVEILELLEAWDGTTAVSSRGAAAFHVLMDLLVHRMFSEPVGERLLERYLRLPFVRPQEVVAEALNEALALREPGGWTDYRRARVVVVESLRQTWFRLSNRLGPNRERWSWGRLHPLGFYAFATDLDPRRRQPLVGPIPVSGDGSTIKLTAWDSAQPFRVNRAATYRMAVDLAAPDRMLTSLAPGQSEHLDHPHFDDGISRWKAGRASLLVTNRLLVDEDSVDLLVLNPAP